MEVPVNKFLGVLVVAIALLSSAAPLASLERKQDRFSGATTWTARADLAERHSEYMWVADSAHLTAEINREGVALASLMIMTSNGTRGRSPGWRYLGVERVLWLVDGQPFDVAPAKAVRSPQRGFVVEMFIQPLTLAELDAVGSADLVEFKIGSDEFRLPAALQQAAREALVHLQAEGASASGQDAQSGSGEYAPKAPATPEPQGSP